METNETHALLLSAVSEAGSDAYKALYEAAESSLYELASSWSKESHDKTYKLLTMWSRLIRRINRRLNGGDSTVDYEAGRLSGIIEVFEYLYRQEEEIKRIDSAISELLSSSKPSSKRILHILYEAGKNYDWVTNAELIKQTSLASNALSNIMKRLVTSNAVELIREGRTVSYRITPAGKRYYENYLASSMNHDLSGGYDVVSEKLDSILEHLNEPMNQKSVSEIRTDSIVNTRKNSASASLFLVRAANLQAEDSNYIRNINMDTLLINADQNKRLETL
ncbi:MAG: hypothetical protein Q4C20_01095 [Erysipelotrichaceae bacterium]|nr:hypothetical protein [Erysipelotrichaceae bacterium]